MLPNVVQPNATDHVPVLATEVRESLDAELKTLEVYRQLLELVEGRSIALEEFARQMIYAEELHAAEVDKMLRKPGDIGVVRRPTS